MAHLRTSLTFVRPPNDGPAASETIDSNHTRLEQVLQLAAHGLTDKAIALELGVSSGTIRTYWDRLRAMFSASTRGEVIAKAMNEALDIVRTELETKCAILDRCGFGVIMLDHHGTVVYVNCHVVNYCGRDIMDIVGQDLSTLVQERGLLDHPHQWNYDRDVSIPIHFYEDGGKFNPHVAQVTAFEEKDGQICRWLISLMPIAA